MVTWTARSVEHPDARLLLGEYFDDRAAGFPGGPAAYHRTTPTPAQFLDDDGVFLVGYDGDEPVACGGVRRIPEVGGLVTFEVKHLWSRPAHRGRGLGRELLRELASAAWALGAAQLVLDTNTSQVAASGLYASEGYIEIPPYNTNPNANLWLGRVLERSS